MVNSDNEIQVLKNGGKSQPNSPITLNAPGGGATRVPGSESSEDEREGQIRVGRDYQAVPPPYIPKSDRRPEQCAERALLVWSPSGHITNQKLDEFIQVAKEKYGYNAEQALGMLFWHKHDLDRAIQDLANFTPFPDEWSVEDKVLFEQAFQFHGKSFHRIRQMLPDKSIAALVKYYYSWKKTRTRTSLMDRQARKLTAVREDGAYGEDSFPEPGSDDEDKEAASEKCGNCGIPCHTTHPTGSNDKTPKGQLCGTCHQFWSRTGQMRPTTGPMRKDGVKPKHAIFRNSSQPPKGMHINHDDLVALATGPPGQGEGLLRALDREIVSNKRLVQNNKQMLSSLRRKARERDSEPYRVPEPANRINARWTNEELLLAVQGIRKFGKNFSAIASILGTKTESHVRSFFVNYKRRYNLDTAYKEYEAEFGPTDSGDIDDSPDVSKDDTNGLMDIKESTESSPKSSLPSSPRSKSPAGAKVNGVSSK